MERAASALQATALPSAPRFFMAVFGTVGPLYAIIFAYESMASATKDLPLSQRLIHTRVYGQAIAVGATVAVMAILKAQEDRGGLPFGETAPQETALTRLYSVSAENYGRPSRALGDKGKDLYGRGIRDRDAWAEDNVGDKYGLKFTQVIVPMLYMPAFPLTFIFLRSRVTHDTLNKVLGSMIFVALLHAGYIQFGDSTMTGA